MKSFSGRGRVLLPLLVLAMALVAIAGCGGGEARRERHVAQGDAFMAERKFDKALLEYRNALQIEPKDAAVRAKAGLAAEKSGDPEDAIKLYRVALAADGTLLLARTRLARFYALAGLHEEANEYLEPGFKQAPDSADLLSVRAIVKGNSGDLDGALQDAKAATSKDPANSEAATVLATVLWQQGDRPGAVAALTDAVARIPDDPDLRLTFAQMLFMVDRKGDAEAQLAEIVRLQPDRYLNRARLIEMYDLQGKHDQAIKAAADAVAAFPDELDAKLMYAKLLASHRSLAEAEKLLQGYREQAPENVELALAVGRFYEANARPADAEAIYAGILELDPTDAEKLTAETRIARLKFDAGDHRSAREMVEKVLAGSPTNAEALVTRAELALVAGDAGAAVIDLRRALGNEPDSVPLARALARAHVQAGETALAEQVLRGVLDLNPSNPAAAVALAEFLVEQGRGQEAKPLLQQLVVAQPGNVTALAALARVQILGGDTMGAVQTATVLQALQPDSPSGFLLAGQVEEAQRRGDAARKAYQMAAKADPNAIEPVAALARLDLAEGKPERALADLGARIDAGKDPATARVLRGQVYLSMKRPDDAVVDFTTAIKQQPRLVPAYSGLANAQLAKGKPDDAIKALRSGLQETKGSPMLALQLGLLLERQGQIDDAARIYEDALVRNPNEDSAANNLAMLLASHRTDKASLDKALDLVKRFEKSTNPTYLDTRGWVLYQGGKYAEAVAVLKEAVKRAPGQREFRYHLGLAELKIGKKEDARANLTAAVSEGPEYPGIEDARALLKSL